MSNSINIGCRVAFARQFLRNTGQFTGWAPFARGEVVLQSKPLRDGVHMVTVKWDDNSTSNVLDCNLVREDRIHLEPA
jgi:hypothetical protein